MIPIAIVGVVGDVKITGLDEAVKPVLYYSFRQGPSTFANLVARTNSDPNALASSIRNEVRNLEPDAAILNVRSMDEMISQTPASFMRRFPALLISIFAGVALLLGVDRYLRRRLLFRQSTNSLHRRAHGARCETV